MTGTGPPRSGATSYTDSTVAAGTTYFYLLTATDPSGTSGFSNQGERGGAQPVKPCAAGKRGEITNWAPK